MAFEHTPYLKFKIATDRPTVLVDAVHAKSPHADLYTGHLALDIAAQSGCHVIIGAVSRQEADLNRHPIGENRAAVLDYRRTLRHLLAKSGQLNERGAVSRPFLHLALHGMANRPTTTIALGTRRGKTCDFGLRQWLHEQLQAWLTTYSATQTMPGNGVVTLDDPFPGHQSLEAHRHGDPANDYPGFGSHFNSIQVELNHTLRQAHRPALIVTVSNLIHAFSDQITSAE